MSGAAKQGTGGKGHVVSWMSHLEISGGVTVERIRNPNNQRNATTSTGLARQRWQSKRVKKTATKRTMTKKRRPGWETVRERDVERHPSEIRVKKTVNPCEKTVSRLGNPCKMKVCSVGKPV
ncbi:unnamed protein product [Ectocarpus sp. 4 AP-2014]